MRENRTKMLAAFVLSFTLLPAISSAQTYPAKPIRFVVPFPTGGALDIVARVMSPRLAELLGQPVLVDNKPGAAGTMGAGEAARATPDGYTIFIGEPGGVTIAPSLRKDLPYDPIRDLAPITTIATIPMVFIANPGIGVKSLSELVTRQRGKSDPLNFGTPGTGTVQHLTGEQLRLETGLALAHIPYKGGGLAVNDLMGGQLPLLVLTMPTVINQMKAGKILGLAILSRSRHAAFPEMQTVSEAGYAGFEQGIWMGLFAPGATPRPVIARLHAEIVKTLESKDVKEKLENGGNEIRTTSPEEFGAFIKADIARWAKVVKEAGVVGN
ncbi:MAG: Bug family tripartite tricarboxylate transporter substrate binding protein [Burkholderiales bacterium]